MKTVIRNLNELDIGQAGLDGVKSGAVRLRLIFAASGMAHSPEFLSALKDLPPEVIVLGCSTAGEIFGADVRDGSVSIADVEFERTRLKPVSAKINQTDESFQVGKELAEALNDPDLKGVLVLSDGLTVNGSHLLEGLNSVLDQSVVVTGGLAGDGSAFKSTWVLVDRVPTAGFVTALGFYGNDVQLHHGSQGGWDIFGPERLITRSEKNVLYEIDNQPALELYKRYLGDKATELPASALLFPIKIWKPGEESGAVVRTILGVNEDDKSMTFAGNIPSGFSAQLMRANFDRLIEGAASAATALGASAPGLSIAISCVGRKLLLGQRIEEEVQAALERMPKGSGQIGFYSYGEISPLVRGGRCHLHNQTMTLTYISESGGQDAA